MLQNIDTKLRTWSGPLFTVVGSFEYGNEFLGSSGYYMYRQFNIQQFYVLPTQYIYVFYVDLRTNSDYFPIQH